MVFEVVVIALLQFTGMGLLFLIGALPPSSFMYCALKFINLSLLINI